MNPVTLWLLILASITLGMAIIAAMVGGERPVFEIMTAATVALALIAMVPRGPGPRGPTGGGHAPSCACPSPTVSR